MLLCLACNVCSRSIHSIDKAFISAAFCSVHCMHVPKQRIASLCFTFDSIQTTSSAWPSSLCNGKCSSSSTIHSEISYSVSWLISKPTFWNISLISAISLSPSLADSSLSLNRDNGAKSESQSESDRTEKYFVPSFWDCIGSQFVPRTGQQK